MPPDRKPRRPSGAPRKRSAGGSSAARKSSSAAPRKRTATGFGKKKSGGAGGDKRKRTSKNTDERNPTRSGVEYPSRKFRRKDEEPPAPAPKRKSSLRRVEKSAPEPGRPSKRGQTQRPRKSSPPRRRRPKTTEATEELARLAGRNARRAQDQLARAAEAFEAGRERDALRMLRPLRDAYPDASAVRELMGLAHYRVGQYQAAANELYAFVELTDSVEQHPVLMDCMRALGKYKKVDELWDDLATASPSSALVSEGRIVYAGSRADRGRVKEAIAILQRKGAEPKRIQEHHLRLWYALADLYERAGEYGRARDLFLRIRKHDASFADVAERLTALR